MAHSCGGGSSSGSSGGFRCSYHSSVRIGNSRSDYSDRYHHHYRPKRYSYMTSRRKKKYIYSYDNPAEPNPVSPSVRILWIGVVIFMIYLFGTMLFFPRDTLNRNSRILIDDQMQVISNEERLRKTMNRFYEETTVTPAVITVSEEQWQQTHDDFPQFALQQYNDHFEDEFHLLIVYAVPERCRGNLQTGSSRGQWHFECIIGNDVEESISDELSVRFSKNIYDRLVKEKDPGRVFAASFNWLIDTRSSFVESNRGIVVTFTLLSPFTFAPYLLNFYRTCRRFKYRNAVLDKLLSKEEKRALRKQQKKNRKSRSAKS